MSIVDYDLYMLAIRLDPNAIWSIKNSTYVMWKSALSAGCFPYHPIPFKHELRYSIEVKLSKLKEFLCKMSSI